MSSETLKNQNALVEELRMRREAIRLLEEKQQTMAATAYGAGRRQRRRIAPLFRVPTECMGGEISSTPATGRPSKSDAQYRKSSR